MIKCFTWLEWHFKLCSGCRPAIEVQPICGWSAGARGPAEGILCWGAEAGALWQCSTGGAADGAGNTHAHHCSHTHERQQQSLAHAHHCPAQTGFHSAKQNTQLKWLALFTLGTNISSPNQNTACLHLSTLKSFCIHKQIGSVFPVQYLKCVVSWLSENITAINWGCILMTSVNEASYSRRSVVFFFSRILYLYVHSACRSSQRSASPNSPTFTLWTWLVVRDKGHQGQRPTGLKRALPSISV